MRLLRQFIALLCALPFAATAQQLTAREVMDRVSAQFTESDAMKIAFIIKSQDDESGGTLCIRGKKFVLETAGMKTWFDGTTQWSYIEENDEVNVAEPTAEELQVINPYAWLTLYKKSYDLKLTGGKLPNCCEVTMASRAAKADMQYIILQVDKSSYRPQQIVMRGKTGRNSIQIDVKSYQTGLKLADDFFTFPKKEYPTAEIIDLR